MEILDANYRTIVGMLYATTFSVAFMGVAGYGYAIRDMKKLQIVMAVPSLLLIFYAW